MTINIFYESIELTVEGDFTPGQTEDSINPPISYTFEPTTVYTKHGDDITEIFCFEYDRGFDLNGKKIKHLPVWDKLETLCYEAIEKEYKNGGI